MSVYKFELKHYGGCAVCVDASTLADARKIFNHVTNTISCGNNNVIDRVTKTSEEVIFSVRFDKA